MFHIYLYLSPIVAILLILINYFISLDNSYIEKKSPFECGFTIDNIFIGLFSLVNIIYI